MLGTLILELATSTQRHTSMIDLSDMFRLFTQSGFKQENNQFQGGPAEMFRLQQNLEEFKEEEEFKTRFGDDL